MSELLATKSEMVRGLLSACCGRPVAEESMDAVVAGVATSAKWRVCSRCRRAEMVEVKNGK